MNDSASAASGHLDDRVYSRFVLRLGPPKGVRARAALAMSALAGFAILHVIGARAGIPPLRSFDGSLLRQDMLVHIVAVALGVAICILAGTFLAGAVHFEAGVFSAAIGLIALSLRSGTVGSVLQDAGASPSVFMTFAVELGILAAVMVGGWYLQLAMGRSKIFALVDRGSDTSASDQRTGVAQSGEIAIAVAAHIVATGVLILLLAQTDSKNQVIAAVGLASLISAFSVHNGFPIRPSIWFWLGPFVLGIAGYIIANLAQYPGIGIGHPQGMFAALARPLPLDYAGAGTAGSILGYWLSRHADKPSDAPEASDQSV